MRLIWNSSQFWACSIALTAFIQLLVLFLMLPAIFTLGLYLRSIDQRKGHTQKQLHTCVF